MSDSKLEPKIVFRAIGPEHRELIEEGFARLSPDARYLRFFGAKHRLTPGELRYLSEPDGDDHFALGAAWLHPSGMLEGLGVARYVRSPDDPKLAHVAVTVLDEAQGRGLGVGLLRRVAWVANLRGVARLRFMVLPENVAMRTLLASRRVPLQLEERTLIATCPVQTVARFRSRHDPRRAWIGGRRA